MNDVGHTGPVWAIATVNLPGLPTGTVALVDPDKPGISRRIAAGYLRVCTEFECQKIEEQIIRSGGGKPAWPK